MGKPLLAAALVIAAANVVGAQPSATISLGPGVDHYDRAARGDTTEPSVSVDGTLAHRFASGRLRVAYDLDVTTYAASGDWRSVQHHLGGSYRVDFGSSATTRLFVGTSTVLRRNGAAWDAADYTGGAVFGNLEVAPREGVTFRTGYRFDVRRFSALPSLDQTQQDVFGSVLVNLPSRTTLIGEASGGFKAYAGGVASSAAPGIVESNGTQGMMSGNAPGSPHGPASAVSVSGLATIAATVSDNSARASAISLYGRLAQGVGARASVIVETSRRFTGGRVVAAVITTPPGFFDDGVYDDPFASDSLFARVAMKLILANDATLSGSGSWQDKPYRETPATDIEGSTRDGVLRHDRVVRAGVVTTWPLLTARTDVVELDLVTTYDFTRHRSTTADYGYQAHMVGIGVRLSY